MTSIVMFYKRSKFQKPQMDGQESDVGQAGENAATNGEGESESLRLGQLRLLIALDALLVEGSVGGAAKQMGLSIAAMSRLLGQIRGKFNDPILVRSGRNMVATPKAEALRGRLRRLANGPKRC